MVRLHAVLRNPHHACFLPQICVIGPWPYGLLQELYYCALAMGVKPHVNVMCLRCRKTKVGLKTVRDEALERSSLFCRSGCRESSSAGPGRTHDGEEPFEEEDGDSEDSLDRGLDMGTLGFATWIVELKDPKKRGRVVKRAIEAAQRAMEAASSGATATAGDEGVADAPAACAANHQRRHAAFNLERCAKPWVLQSHAHPSHSSHCRPPSQPGPSTATPAAFCRTQLAQLFSHTCHTYGPQWPPTPPSSCCVLLPWDSTATCILSNQRLAAAAPPPRSLTPPRCQLQRWTT